MEQARTRELRPAVGAAVCAAYLALVLFWVLRQPGGDAAARFLGLAYVLPALGAALLGFHLAAAPFPTPVLGRVGWGVVATGALAFATSQGAATYDRLVRASPAAFPALCDHVYLAVYPCLCLGLLTLALATGCRSWPRALIDSLISLGAPLALSWYFLLKPIWDTQLSQLAITVRLAYPLIDLGVLFCSFVLTHAPVSGRRGPGLRLLSVGASTLAITDLVYAYLTLPGSFAPMGLLDVGWAAGFALLALGTLHVRWDALREQEEISLVSPSEAARSDPWSFVSALRLLAPVVATAGAAVGMMWVDYQRPGASVSFDVLAVSFALVISVMGRQAFSLVENAQTHSNLHVFNRRLEEKVLERTHQLQTLHDIARAANSSLHAEEMLDQVLQRVAGALHAEAAAVWVIQGEAPPGELQLFGQVGLDPAVHAPLLATVPARWKNGLSQVLLDRHSLPVPFVAADGTRNENGTAPECLCAILQWQERPLGVLGALRWQQRFVDAERRLLEAVALELSSSLQNAHLYDLAVRAADRDGVTHLLNHRAVVQRLDEEFKRATRTGQSMAVLLLDLNNFKLFNDTHGHLVGDQVLKTTAALLTQHCRATDVIGRYGGDEFIIICPATDAAGARELASRIHDQMAATTVQGTSGERLPLSSSIGLAVYPEGAGSQHELLARADMNMYDAKAKGGPAIVGCDAEEEEGPVDYAGGFSTLDALVTAVDKRDHYTRRHSEDVTEYSLMIAEQLGLSQDTMRTLRFAGLLHDLGKIAIPDAILRKPSALTDEEYALMKQHPVYGWLIVSAIPSLSETLPAIRHHHERYDGRGYPDALAGEEIPLLGRLMAVADAFSAMTTDRPYRKGMPIADAVEQLHKGRGTQFDPVMVDAFLAALTQKARAAA